jgi:Fe2+ or Zn2+ uptake regulation protein
MDIDNPELFRRLREHGLRSTEARRLVLALLSEENGHPSTDGIIKALRERGFPVSIATLYQNLDKLVEAALLIRIKGPDGLMRFDANLAPHHHLVCDSCGKMVDAKMNREALLQESPVVFQSGISLTGWHIDNLKIEYHGICPNCRK